MSVDPDVSASVLHGVLLGPVTPTVDQRRALDIPTLVLGHRADLIHPFSDASALVSELPRAELITARTALELRLLPDRLTAAVAAFLDRVWSEQARTPVGGPVEMLVNRQNAC